MLDGKQMPGISLTTPLKLEDFYPGQTFTRVELRQFQLDNWSLWISACIDVVGTDDETGAPVRQPHWMNAGECTDFRSWKSSPDIDDIELEILRRGKAYEGWEGTV